MNFKLLLLALPCLASAAPMLQLEVEGSLDDFRKLDVQTIHESANAKVMEFMERDLAISQECADETAVLVQDQTLSSLTQDLLSSCQGTSNTVTCSFASNAKKTEFDDRCVALGGDAITYGMTWSMSAEGQTVKLTYNDIPFCMGSSCDANEVLTTYGDSLKQFGELLGFDVVITTGSSSASDKVVKGLTAALGLVLAGFTLWN